MLSHSRQHTLVYLMFLLPQQPPNANFSPLFEHLSHADLAPQDLPIFRDYEPHLWGHLAHSRKIRPAWMKVPPDCRLESPSRKCCSGMRFRQACGYLPTSSAKCRTCLKDTTGSLVFWKVIGIFRLAETGRLLCSPESLHCQTWFLEIGRTDVAHESACSRSFSASNKP